MWPFFDNQRASFPVEVVLPEPCRPDNHKDARRLVGEAQFGFVAAQYLDQLFMNDLDYLLGRRKCVEYFLAHGLFLDVVDKLFDNFEVYVGFQQRHANFAQRAVHVLRRELAFTAQVFENPLQLI